MFRLEWFHNEVSRSADPNWKGSLVSSVLVRLKMNTDHEIRGRGTGLLRIIANDVININRLAHANLVMDFKDEIGAQCSQVANAGPLEDARILVSVYKKLKKRGIEIGSGSALFITVMLYLLAKVIALVTMASGSQYPEEWPRTAGRKNIFQTRTASNQAEENKNWKRWIRWTEGKRRDIGLLGSTKIYRMTEFERTNTVAEQFLEEFNEDFPGSPSPE